MTTEPESPTIPPPAQDVPPAPEEGAGLVAGVPQAAQHDGQQAGRRKHGGRRSKYRGTGNPKRPFAFDPFRTMWRHPRATVRAIVAINPEYAVSSVAALGGIGRALDRASQLDMGSQVGTLGTLVAAMIGGAFGGVFTLYTVGWVTHRVARLLGGQASTAAVRAALAWSTVPLIWALLLWIPKLVLFGNEIFMRRMPSLEGNPLAVYAVILFFVLDLAAALWSLVLMVRALSEVERFSVWRALVTLVLGWLIVLGVSAAIGLGIGLWIQARSAG